MLIVVSPAKTLDYESPLPPLRHTKPRMLARSAELVEGLRQLTPANIGTLMKVSDKIAGLNAARFAEWRPEASTDDARAAVFAFKGDVYTGLAIEQFDAEQLKTAQQRLRILSGLYGLLRPLDLMRPYRLEMGTRFANRAGKDLYAFWGDEITEQLNADLKTAGADVLVNLASNEYFRAVRPAKLRARIITPVFHDEKNGQYKIISFYAKKARGLMAAWILQNDITEPEALKDFDVAGYRFHAAGSNADTLLFRRKESAQ